MPAPPARKYRRIKMSANVENMFYYGEIPWHGLGTQLDHPATAEEAIQVAGLNFPVEKDDVYFMNAKKEFVRIEGRQAIVRADKQIAFNILTPRYAPVQNSEAFNFFDSIVGEKKAIYHTAGSLGQGEKVWILAKMDGQIIVGKDDPVDKFLLLSNSHDGSSTLKVLFTPIRVVCQNTLNIALANKAGGRMISIRHMGSIDAKVEQAKKVLGFATENYEAFGVVANRLAKTAVDSRQVKKFLEALFPMPTMGDDKIAGDGVTESLRVKNVIAQRDAVEQLFTSGRGNDKAGIKRTAWALFNGATEYSDYYGFREKINPNRRLDSVWFGNGAELKDRAFGLVKTIAGIK